jgi:hypothetical protein
MTAEEADEDEFDSSEREERPLLPALVPKEEAEAIIRAFAEKHGAKGVLRKLGDFPPDHLANAAARFAKEMTDEETPLALVDTSMMRNGKSGFLLTNRGLFRAVAATRSG